MSIAPEDDIVLGGPEVIGNIIIIINGKTYQQPIHRDDYVYADLAEAVRNSKDPAKALLWLADAGSKALLGSGIKPENWRVGRSNAIGPTPPPGDSGRHYNETH